MNNDPVNHPAHYTSDPSNVECIEIARHLPFALGNAVKYLWRAGLKEKNKDIEDAQKALWYLNDYRNFWNGLDERPDDPALATLPWKRIAQWALYQDHRLLRVAAIVQILHGRYLQAAYNIEGLIHTLSKIPDEETKQ